MFWEKWIHDKYLVGQMVCGLEIILEENSTRCFYTITQNKNNKLSIIESNSGIDITHVIQTLEKRKIPVCVGVNGKGLMFKKVIDTGTEKDYEATLNKAFPTINKDDFYIQYYKQVNCDGYVSLYRKEQLNGILDLLSKSKVNLTSVYLGYSFVADAMPLVTLLNKIETNNSIIEFSNSCIENILLTNIPTSELNEFTIEGIKLNKETVLGFALSFVYFLNTENCFNYNNDLELYRRKHFEKTKLKLLVYCCISIAFTFCLVNFFCFNYYFNKNKVMETELNIYEGKYEKINNVLSKYETQKNLIEESGLLNETKISKYVDRIAATVPKEVTLCDWLINPPIKNTENDSLIKFSKNVIKIKGNCNKSLIINEWVNVLKSQNFVRDVDLQQFSSNSEGSHPNFELKIITE